MLYLINGQQHYKVEGDAVLMPKGDPERLSNFPKGHTAS